MIIIIDDFSNNQTRCTRLATIFNEHTKRTAANYQIKILDSIIRYYKVFD